MRRPSVFDAARRFCSPQPTRDSPLAPFPPAGYPVPVPPQAPRANHAGPSSGAPHQASERHLWANVGSSQPGNCRPTPVRGWDHANATLKSRVHCAPGLVSPDDSLPNVADFLGPGATFVQRDPASARLRRIRAATSARWSSATWFCRSTARRLHQSGLSEALTQNFSAPVLRRSFAAGERSLDARNGLGKTAAAIAGVRRRGRASEGGANHARGMSNATLQPRQPAFDGPGRSSRWPRSSLA